MGRKDDDLFGVTLTLNNFYVLEAGDERAAEDIMRALGITWREMQVDSWGEEVIFRGCRNVPDSLPNYITVGRTSP